MLRIAVSGMGGPSKAGGVSPGFPSLGFSGRTLSKDSASLCSSIFMFERGACRGQCLPHESTGAAPVGLGMPRLGALTWSESQVPPSLWTWPQFLPLPMKGPTDPSPFSYWEVDLLITECKSLNKSFIRNVYSLWVPFARQFF